MKRDQLIVALDVESLAQVKKIVRALSPSVVFYKVGLRLFTREGPEVVRWLKKRKLKVFLDLKFHDIPNTVAQAVESATQLGVDLMTVHALGGQEMMSVAVKAARQTAKKLKKPIPKIFAVTVLTSTDDLTPIGISSSIPKQVLRLAKMAQSAQVDGIVCSPNEVKDIKRHLRSSLRFLTPGIRLEEDTQKDDQKRVATPDQALKNGADYIVVGRPILLSPHPQRVVQKILRKNGSFPLRKRGNLDSQNQ